MINVRNLDLRSYAVISMLVLWAFLTFSIALKEIAFVCALIFWVGWHIQLKAGLSISTPSTPGVESGDRPCNHRVLVKGFEIGGWLNPRYEARECRMHYVLKLTIK
jgi:hypothetical protein